MITENDIVFDNVYEEVATRLDWILDEAIEDIGDEWGINDKIMIKIVETWSQGVSVRLPLTTKVDKKTMELINKEQSNE